MHHFPLNNEKWEMGLISNFSFPITYFPWTHVFFSHFQPWSLPMREDGGLFVDEEMDGARGHQLMDPRHALSAHISLSKQTISYIYTSEQSTQTCHAGGSVVAHARTAVTSWTILHATSLNARHNLNLKAYQHHPHHHLLQKILIHLILVNHCVALCVHL